MKTTRIAINGLGRIGRLFLRQIFNNPNLEVVVINDLGDLENLAYLVKYDTVYHGFPAEVSAKKDGDKNYLVVNGKDILMIQEKDPAKLPWGALNIDLVVESTGVYESFEKANAHILAGAKKVVISAPAKDAEGSAGGKSILMGINDGELANIVLSSNVSCTTNATSPLIAIMNESIGVEKAVLNTIHAYTNTQTMVDSPVKGSDFRRGRAGAQNIIPSSTGAAIAVTRILKDLTGKFDGLAVRVPVVTGSLIDLTFISKKPTSTEEIAGIFKKAAADPRWQGILQVSENQIVSSDIIGSCCGTIVDLKFMKVVDGNLVKILSWYDNEWGYVTTLVRHVLKAAESIK
ncbi:MAG: glyceraldehyde 3-phosphate dehydrogenase NAD-binding domain-containing protein [Candidatus Pacebacteria bacterium]|nr:glyceraldehyde 3-phosphate dehydrogenase NAD-binding domain-containing protein [Candidatus Paceibacterota bacterium]